MATIFMSVYGRQGLRELAEQNLAKTAYAVSAFSRAGVRVLCSGPRFHEFVIQLETSPRETKQAQRELWREKIIAGLPLRRYYPELSESLLICTTECAPRETIDRMVAGFAQAQRRATEAQELTAAR
jgi:glycine dehydrogenase subunit 1